MQVGSFSQSSNARRVSDKFAAYYRDVRIDQVMAGARPFYRVRMGAFDTREAARERATESARFGYPIVIVSEMNARAGCLWRRPIASIAIGSALLFAGCAYSLISGGQINETHASAVETGTSRFASSASEVMSRWF